MSSGTIPKYSILIPTRNGLRYLPYAISSVLSQPCYNLELIISDNHSQDGTAEFLSSLTDPRLRIIRPPKPLPMSSHFEFIVSQARGEWISLIGDDDALMPFFFEYLENIDLQSFHTEAFVCRRALYFWPGCEDIYGNIVATFSLGADIERRRSLTYLGKTLLSLGDYMELPQLYTCGIVKASAIKKIKDKSSGNFFRGTSPDAYSAAALLSHCAIYYRIDLPLFWTGSSPKSTGYSNASKQENSSINDFLGLNHQQNIGFNSKIPDPLMRRFDLPIIFYEALLNCPFSLKILKSDLVFYIVLGGLSFSQPAAAVAIKQLYRSKTHVLTVVAVVIAILERRPFFTRLIRSFKKKREDVYRPGFSSQSREEYPDISSASKAAAKLFHEAATTR